MLKINRVCDFCIQFRFIINLLSNLGYLILISADLKQSKSALFEQLEMNQQGKLKRPQCFFMDIEDSAQNNNAIQQQLFSFHHKNTKNNNSSTHEKPKKQLSESFKCKLKSILNKNKPRKQQQQACEIVQIYSKNPVTKQNRINLNQKKRKDEFDKIVKQAAILQQQKQPNFQTHQQTQQVQLLFQNTGFKLTNNPNLIVNRKQKNRKPLQVKRFGRVQLIEYSSDDEQKQLVYNRKEHQNSFCAYRRQKIGEKQVKILKQILSKNPNLNRHGIRQTFRKFDNNITFSSLSLLMRKMNIVSKPFPKLSKRTAQEDLKSRNFLQKLYQVPMSKILFFEQISLQRNRSTESVFVQQSRQPWLPQDKYSYRDATISLGVSQKGVVSLAIAQQNISQQQQIENLQFAFRQKQFQYVVLNPRTTNFYQKIVEKCQQLGVSQENIIQLPLQENVDIISGISKKIREKVKRRSFIKSKSIQTLPYPELVENLTQIILDVTETLLDDFVHKLHENLKKMMVFQYTMPIRL